MPRCAGVQNVSRPIDMCQEISQYKPTEVAVTASAEVHTYHGMVCVAGEPASRATPLAMKVPLLRRLRGLWCKHYTVERPPGTAESRHPRCCAQSQEQFPPGHPRRYPASQRQFPPLQGIRIFCANV